MTNNQFELIREYDRLDALLAQEGEARPAEASDLAGEIAVIRLLKRDAAAEVSMPRQAAFRSELRGKLQPSPSRRWIPFASLAAAAALVMAFLFWQDDQKPAAPDLDLDARALAVVAREDTRSSMIAYLEEAEHLLRAIRDFEPTCSEEQADLTHERRLANSLLIRQNEFSVEMNKPQFIQARQLFAQLETVLVDLNGLEPCTDVLDLELLNDHISKKRLLSKVRIIAQDIELS